MGGWGCTETGEQACGSYAVLSSRLAETEGLRASSCQDRFATTADWEAVSGGPSAAEAERSLVVGRFGVGVGVGVGVGLGGVELVVLGGAVARARVRKRRSLTSLVVGAVGQCGEPPRFSKRLWSTRSVVQGSGGQAVVRRVAAVHRLSTGPVRRVTVHSPPGPRSGRRRVLVAGLRACTAA